MLKVEQLERRDMCAVVDPVIVDGMLTIVGGDNADSIVVSLDPGNVVKVVRNLGGAQIKAYTFPFADVQSLDIRGGAGNDTIFVSKNVPLPTYIEGGDGNDFIRGSDQSNMIDGGAGNDYIYGGEGRDVLIGGAGSDILYGYGGDDLFVPDTLDNTMDELAFARAVWLSDLTFAERSTAVKAILKVVDVPGYDVIPGNLGSNLILNP